MNFKTEIRTAISFIARLALCAALVSPTMAQDATLPPAGQKVVLTVKAEGVQIYGCKEVAGATQWVFQGPEAKLFDASGKEFGTHGAGPFWKSKDGSLVKGKVMANSKPPGAEDIAWLLLKASEHEGDGVLSGVEYIRRSETHGGAAPAGGCDHDHLESSVRIAYTAVYTFYKP